MSAARSYTDQQLNQYIDFLEGRIAFYEGALAELSQHNFTSLEELRQVEDTIFERRHTGNPPPELSRSQMTSIRSDNETVRRLYRQMITLTDRFSQEIGRIETRVTPNTRPNRNTQSARRRSRRSNRRSRRARSRRRSN